MFSGLGLLSDHREVIAGGLIQVFHLAITVKMRRSFSFFFQKKFSCYFAIEL